MYHLLIIFLIYILKSLLTLAGAGVAAATTLVLASPSALRKVGLEWILKLGEVLAATLVGFLRLNATLLVIARSKQMAEIPVQTSKVKCIKKQSINQGAGN